MALARVDSATQTTPSVVLLRWPAESAVAERLEASGLPFLLLLGNHEPPPLSGYRLMDWIRSPCDPDELIARRTSLEERFARSSAAVRPYLDSETRRLTFGRRTVDLSPSQVRAMRLLVRRYREVVPTREVSEAFGGTAEHGRQLLPTRVMRLRRRACAVGLSITPVRGVGYTLEAARWDDRDASTGAAR